MQHTFLHQKMVAYESLDHNESNIFLIRMWQLPRLDPCATVDAMFHSRKSQFREKNPLLIKKSSDSCSNKNATTRNYLLFLRHYLSIGCLREVLNNGKFQTLSSQIGCGGLREVVAYKGFQN